MENNNTPFLNLLKEENLSKIKIDKELIPVFKIVVAKISEYFLEHDLMGVRNWDSFFNQYILMNNEQSLEIFCGSISEDKNCGAGEYSKDQNKIAVCKMDGSTFDSLCSTLCHEFIHFLVMSDSNSLQAKLSDSSFFNEGMTELLTMQIMNDGLRSSYFHEVNMVEFYCLLAKDKDPFTYFLNDKFYFEDDIYAPINLINSTDRFQQDNSLASMLEIQRNLISGALEEYNVLNFDDYLHLITKLNHRPYYDKDYMDGVFERITDRYLDSCSLEGDRQMLKQYLLTLCELSNKACLYENHEVEEFVMEDLHIAFDRAGKSYNEFPHSGDKERGQIQVDGKRILVIHRDKKYSIEIEKMKCKNWLTIYDHYLQQLSPMLENLKTSNHKR